MREFTSVLLGARFHAAVFLDGPLLALALPPFSLSLPPYLYRRPTRPPRSPPLLCSAWLLDLLHLATQRLCSSSHPSVFPRLSVWPPPPSLHSFPL